MIVKRNRRKQTVAFCDRLEIAAKEARDAAEKLPEGPGRESLLKKAKQAEMAQRINGWLTSPGSQAQPQAPLASSRSSR